MPPVAFVAAQLDAVSDDVEIDAVKIGMLQSAEIIAAVRGRLARVRPPLVVRDPVMVATSGDRLLDPAAEEALRALCGIADLVTPNLAELAVLTGRPRGDLDVGSRRRPCARARHRHHRAAEGRAPQ
ncbi:bifunctional hydroxymethylpyrimidine kinase/phosphomethylpyrimidine kinase [Microbacterium sp. LWS13-1.2]|uniref:bifunctional hydroxymethylpyrimidine kinase/phosphomethylpyrimidine kinase n=1 Tax=Microbacterium sp. LWS13-1.2 TaxID=3135264 RepID=UPI0032DA2985